MEKVTVYVDGFNLYHGAVKRRPENRWLDLVSLRRALLPNDDVELIRYFTARVRPQPDDPKAPKRQNTYLRALSDAPLVKCITGGTRCTTSGRRVPRMTSPSRICSGQHLRPKPFMRWMWSRAKKRNTKHYVKAYILVDEEKGSDVNLATYLMYDVFKGGNRSALVFSNDTDRREPIRLCVENGAHVWLCNPGSGLAAGGLRKAHFIPCGDSTTEPASSMFACNGQSRSTELLQPGLQPSELHRLSLDPHHLTSNDRLQLDDPILR